MRATSAPPKTAPKTSPSRTRRTEEPEPRRPTRREARRGTRAGDGIPRKPNPGRGDVQPVRADERRARRAALRRGGASGGFVRSTKVQTAHALFALPPPSRSPQVTSSSKVSDGSASLSWSVASSPSSIGRADARRDRAAAISTSDEAGRRLWSTSSETSAPAARAHASTRKNGAVGLRWRASSGPLPRRSRRRRRPRGRRFRAAGSPGGPPRRARRSCSGSITQPSQRRRAATSRQVRSREARVRAQRRVKNRSGTGRAGRREANVAFGSSARFLPSKISLEGGLLDAEERGRMPIARSRPRRARAPGRSTECVRQSSGIRSSVEGGGDGAEDGFQPIGRRGRAEARPGGARKRWRQPERVAVSFRDEPSHAVLRSSRTLPCQRPA